MASKLQELSTKLLAADNLPAWFPVHHFNQPSYNYKTGVELVDWKQPSLWFAVGMVLFNPIFWNTVARNEYRNKTMTKIFGSPYHGCYVLAVTIFSLGIFRDVLYERALRDQPHLAVLSHPAWKAIAWGLFGLGQLFVITSIYALGITGTYLGDYFGILMSSRVTGFPFNVLSDPMYVGSTLAFLGSAIQYESPVGLGISALVWVVYAVALRFEGPFTDKIYSSAASKKSDSAPSTPRKSTRLAGKRSAEKLHSGSGSYAQAAAEPPASNGLPSTAPAPVQPLPAQTPRTRRRLQTVQSEEAASPARMTRSRSKGRVSSDME
ncbi:Phosphatidyl-N-methylethanolamine N-methyltransferase [Saitozyma podzolica]|uniref:Phosphatidyl-N-methylethanolamine N-methyltransferase n=1 Tax=Saitozyma podzolica TaxID=1890683 RepID=A0A427YE40_9TREE|nr:Phosphatidyl-N-methylethanolamine N-methyltransferase [Saitozyma podzolica]